MWLISGYDSAELDHDRLPVFMSHFPSGTSVQDMAHWAQSARGYDPSTPTGARSDFKAFDWGSESVNIQKYGQATPPIYNLSHYPTHNHRLFMFSGGVDALGSTHDVARLFHDLAP